MRARNSEAVARRRAEVLDAWEDLTRDVDRLVTGPEVELETLIARAGYLKDRAQAMIATLRAQRRANLKGHEHVGMEDSCCQLCGKYLPARPGVKLDGLD